MPASYRATPGGLSLHVRLTPKGGRDAIDGWIVVSSGATYLKARVRAAPEDGKANAALTALLAKTLGVAKSAVRIVSGATSRVKQIEVAGDGDELAGCLDAIEDVS